MSMIRFRATELTPSERALQAEVRQFLADELPRGSVEPCIGMSEPDSGSDLASITTRAERDGDGWVVTGRKIWTTLAHVNDWMILLCRTSSIDETGDKRAGLTQLLVDLHSPGLTTTPIPFIDGTADFAEVVL